MESINKFDLNLVQSLSERTYTNNRITSRANAKEIKHLRIVKQKLKYIATLHHSYYQSNITFDKVGINSGNEVFNGKLRGIWSFLSKGASNKQYSAQISFVAREKYIETGFYFGLAQARDITREERQSLESRLQQLANNLVASSICNPILKDLLEDLFDCGFSFVVDSYTMTVDEWLGQLNENPKGARIVTRIYLNKFNLIDISEVSHAVDRVIPLMNWIDENKEVKYVRRSKNYYIDKLIRNKEIGELGESFIIKKLKENLLKRKLSADCKDNLNHVAKVSDAFGYDIEYRNEKDEIIFIEVKTTTRKKEDLYSNKFFLSSNEHNISKEKGSQYKIYRVYDIFNNPDFQIFDSTSIELEPNGYIAKVKID